MAAVFSMHSAGLVSQGKRAAQGAQLRLGLVAALWRPRPGQRQQTCFYRSR